MLHPVENISSGVVLFLGSQLGHLRGRHYGVVIHTFSPDFFLDVFVNLYGRFIFIHPMHPITVSFSLIFFLIAPAFLFVLPITLPLVNKYWVAYTAGAQPADDGGP